MGKKPLRYSTKLYPEIGLQLCEVASMTITLARAKQNLSEASLITLMVYLWVCYCFSTVFWYYPNCLIP